MKKKNLVKNGIAKDLRTSKYKMQVQKDRKRKLAEAQYDKGFEDGYRCARAEDYYD